MATNPFMLPSSVEEAFAALLKSAGLDDVTVQGDGFTIELSAPPHFRS